MFRLGRLPHDPIALATTPALMAACLALPPAKCDRRGLNYVPRLFQNDLLPVCSAAGLANGMLAVGAVGGFEPVIDDALVPALYAAVVGCQNTQVAIRATAGARLLDALSWQERHGFDVGQQVPLVAISGIVPVGRLQVARCVADLGGAYVGIDLYERDMEMPVTWDDDGRDPGAMVGGHAIWVWDYTGLTDTNTGRVATWGALQLFTWRWLMKRIREAHGLFWRQLAPAMESAVDVERLAAEAEGNPP